MRRVTTNAVVRACVSSVQFSRSVVSDSLCLDPMNRSASGFPVYHQLPEFTQTHVHRVGDAIRHLILCCSHVQFFIAPWTVVCQALLSMGFSRLEYWSGLSFPSSRELSDPRMEPASSASQAGSLPIELPGKPSNALGRLTVQVGLNCGL